MASKIADSNDLKDSRPAMCVDGRLLPRSYQRIKNANSVVFEQQRVMVRRGRHRIQFERPLAYFSLFIHQLFTNFQFL